jgi:hypothetical protein
MWVCEYLLERHGEALGQDIIADIDHWYAIHICVFIHLKPFHAIVFQPCQLFLAFGVSLMAVIFLNGRAMTQRHL